MDLLSVGLEVEDKGSGITVGKGLGIELNRGPTWSGFAKLGVALDTTLGDAGGASSWAAPGAALGTTPGVALGAALGTALGATSNGAIGMVLERIEVEEGESLIPID